MKLKSLKKEITYEKLKIMDKYKTKEMIELDNIEKQINEAIESGKIAAVAYKKITKAHNIYDEIIYQEWKVCEDEEEYTYSNNQINNPHDKLIKTILSNEEEVSKVIKKYLNIDIKATNLEKYTSSYISKDYTALESDIVYKMKNKKIYFLIEHQSKIDKSMPYRISQYIAVIMKEAVKKEKIFEEGYLYPKVIPIVIYTGSRKWNIKTSLSEVQEKLEGYEKIENSYELIDVNNYTEEELINDETMISKAMLVEKSKTKEEIEEIIEKIITRITKENEIESIYNFLNYIWSEKLDKGTVEKLSIKLKEKGAKNMRGLEILYNEYNKKFAEGKSEGEREGELKIIKIIKNMLSKNLSTKEIANLTGINEKNIMKIKEGFENIT